MQLRPDKRYALGFIVLCSFFFLGGGGDRYITYYINVYLYVLYIYISHTRVFTYV